jgi:hypothetical protein
MYAYSSGTHGEFLLFFLLSLSLSLCVCVRSCINFCRGKVECSWMTRLIRHPISTGCQFIGNIGSCFLSFFLI